MSELESAEERHKDDQALGNMTYNEKFKYLGTSGKEVESETEYDGNLEA